MSSSSFRVTSILVFVIVMLYLGDNGRLTCADLRCSGMTAHASRMTRDLSGQPMLRLAPDMVREMLRDLGGLPVACETCGAEASLLL